MEKPELVRAIYKLHKEMRALVLESGVIEKSCDRVIHKVEVRQLEWLQEMYDWLSDVRIKEYEEARKIKNSLPDEVWQHYIDFGEVGLREQILLATMMRSLRKRWNGTRPKAKSKGSPTNPNGVSVQSEGVGVDADSGGTR